MKGFILLVTAVVLILILLPFAALVFIIDCFRFRFWSKAGTLFLETAWALDVTANILFQNQLNALFIVKRGYHFGRRGETISSCLGRNWCNGTLTKAGLGLVGLLNRLDKDHCYLAIHEQERVWMQPDPVETKLTLLFTGVVEVLLYLVAVLVTRDWLMACYFLAAVNTAIMFFLLVGPITHPASALYKE